MKLRIAVLSALLLTPSWAIAQESPSLETVLGRFSKMPGLYAEFREEKHMALLAVPLVNEGTLHFSPPGRVARHVRKPTPSSVLIDEKQVRMGDGSKEEALSLKGNPVLRQFLDSFMLILSGDKAGLEASYTLGFKEIKGGLWELSLAPKLSPMKDAIERIVFVADGLKMKTMTLFEVGGDKTVTTFKNVDAKRTYTAAAWAKVFRMPTPKKVGK